MEVLIHLAKSSLCLILFYSFYRLFLRHTTFFQLNRAYLVLSLILSFALPFITIEKRVSIQARDQVTHETGATRPVDETAYVAAAVQISEKRVTAAGVLLTIYVCGALAFLGIFLHRLFRVARLIRSYPKTVYDDLPVVVMTEENPGPGSFSFFNRIFINKADFDHHFDTVYSHEKIHVAQHHSLDILLVELFRVVFWFNPVLGLYKHSLQEVHEFLADTSATNKEDYARFLVSYTMSGNYIHAMTNPFFNSLSLKKRIEMLYRKPDSRYILFRYVPVAPVIILAVMFTATRQYVYATPDSPEPKLSTTVVPMSVPEVIAAAEAGLPVVRLTIDDTEKKIKGKVVDASDNSPLPGAIILVKGYNRGTTTNSEGEFVVTLPSGHDEIVVSFVGYASQTLKIRDEKALSIVLVKEKNQLEEIVVVGYGPVKKSIATDEAVKPAADTAGVWTVVEQMPEFPGGQKELYRFLSKHIRYPGEAARAEIQGKVLISFVVNRLGHIRNPQVARGVGYGLDEEALRVVISMPRWKPALQNGQPVDMEYTLPVSFRLETPDKQGAIQPERNQSEEERQASSSGAAITIKGAADAANPHFSSPGELKHFRNAPRSGWKIDSETAPLYILDGKELSNSSLEQIDPNTIASIEVRKDMATIDRYGEKARNGVLFITTKKGEKK